MDELTKNLEVKSIDEMQKDKNIDLNQQELEIATQEQNTLFTEYDEGGAGTGSGFGGYGRTVRSEYSR